MFITAMTSSPGYIKIAQEDWRMCSEPHGDVQERAHRGMDGSVALLAISCTSPGCHKPSSFSLQDSAGSSEQAAACSEAFLMPCAARLPSPEPTQAPGTHRGGRRFQQGAPVPTNRRVTGYKPPREADALRAAI